MEKLIEIVSNLKFELEFIGRYLNLRVKSSGKLLATVIFYNHSTRIKTPCLSNEVVLLQPTSGQKVLFEVLKIALNR